MSVLDADIRSFDAMYSVLVHRAEEWRREAAAHWQRVTGQAPSEADWQHLRVRCFSEERQRWGTTRNAIESREWGAQPEPAPGPIIIEPSPQPGRLSRISHGPFHRRFYSYWPNAYVRGGSTFVFAGSREDFAALFFELTPDGVVIPLGELLPYRGTTEGWYWDAEGWIYLADGPRLRRVHPWTRQEMLAFELPQDLHGCHVWQPHSSNDGRVHSATVRRNGDGANLGTFVSYRGEPLYFEALGRLDESIVTKDGEYLVIQEDIGGSADNRIVTLRSREERRITDQQGAVGHCDTGEGIVAGEDNMHGGLVVWDLRLPLPPMPHRHLVHNWNMGHVSIRAGRCLLSNATTLELALVDLDTGAYRVVHRHGLAALNYDDQVRANLSPCGTRACFMIEGVVYVLEL